MGGHICRAAHRLLSPFRNSQPAGAMARLENRVQSVRIHIKWRGFMQNVDTSIEHVLSYQNTIGPPNVATGDASRWNPLGRYLFQLDLMTWGA